ncbi:MAG TPA: hypothetical protein VKR43_23250 [Bryobacteraceae bacterium]|jgi:hypothetical protein|nr:hypothetical protein [Bryobacteraceae bacterium]
MAQITTAQPEYVYRCLKCHTEEGPSQKTATLIRMDCQEHGTILHRRFIRRPDGSLEIG